MLSFDFGSSAASEVDKEKEDVLGAHALVGGSRADGDVASGHLLGGDLGHEWGTGEEGGHAVWGWGKVKGVRESAGHKNATLRGQSGRHVAEEREARTWHVRSASRQKTKCKFRRRGPDYFLFVSFFS